MTKTLALLSALLLLGAPARAGESEKAIAKGLLDAAGADAKNHRAHESACRALLALESIDPEILAPDATLLGWLEHPFGPCREAALEVLVFEEGRRPGRFSDKRDELTLAVAKIATSQRLVVREQALGFLERFTHEKRDAFGWGHYVAEHDPKARLTDIVAAYTKGGLNGQAIADVTSSVAELERRADLASLPFVEIRDPAEPFAPPVLELAPELSIERWRAGAKNLLPANPERHTCGPQELVPAAEGMEKLARALRHDPASSEVTETLTTRARDYRKHATAHECIAKLKVTLILVDPKRSDAAIIVMPDDREHRGRIYASGDELRDRDDKTIAGLKVLKISEGSIKLSLDGEEVIVELAAPN